MRARVRHPLRTVAFACLVLAAAAAAAPSGAAVAVSGTFDDASGDAGAAPDITQVVVSNDAAGVITMRIAVPNRPQLGFNDGIILWINADQNAATGSFGDEYRLEKFAFGTFFLRWDGSAWQPFTPGSLLVRWETGQLVVSAARADLGIGAAFDFDAAGVQVTGEDANAWPWDDAPDFGSWTYTIVFAPTLGPAKVQPARPKAGRLVSVSVPVQAGGASVDTGTVKCSATVGGKRVRTVASGLNAGAAGCSWRLPASTAGKTLRGAVTVVTAGGTATKTFSVKVR
jgi:hypothetical protein